MKEDKTIRLGQASRKLNVKMNFIIEFLEERGYKIEHYPYTILTTTQFNLLLGFMGLEPENPNEQFITETLFDKAQLALINDDVKSFSSILKELLDSHITCNCFFRNLPNKIWESLLEKVESLRDDQSDFDLNFTKGFIFLNNKNNSKAFEHLSRALELHPLSDICYSLRATIETDTNHTRLHDARMAVNLMPTARNHFILANVQPIAINAITNYNKAVTLNAQFACAYHNMGIKYQNIKDFSSAVSCYRKCIEIDPNHFGAYYGLWSSFNKLGDYGQALHYAHEGNKKHPKDSLYYFALGEAYARLKKYEEAIRFYRQYLNYFPNDTKAKNNLIGTIFDLEREKAKKVSPLFEEAVLRHIQSDFQSSLKFFNEYLNSGDNNILDQSKEIIMFYEQHLIYFPHDERAKTNLEIFKAKSISPLLGDAISSYTQRDFESSVNYFNEYLNSEKTLIIRIEHPDEEYVEFNHEYLMTYYKALLKRKDLKIEIDEHNPHYIRLSSLKESSLGKVSKNETLTEDEENINKLMVYRSNYRIGFGNFKDSTVQEILNIDPHYVLWCIVNLHHFSISNALFLQENLKNNPNYLEALEINLIKIELLTKWNEEEQYAKYIEECERDSDAEGIEYPSYEQWLEDEFGDEAGTAYWNLD